MDYRIGIGYDIHSLAEGRKLVLGGVEIPYIKGLLGYSDADVLLHAVCDAILGACGLGDLGQLFPDTDPQYQGISSIELLKKVCLLAKEKSFLINNIDTVVIAQEPNLSPFKKKMQQTIAAALEISEEAVNVKAKTNNRLGDIGKGEAICAYAAVMISKGG